MLYDKEILTVYEAENGFVVKCRVPREEMPKEKGNRLCPSPSFGEKMYTATSVPELMKIIKMKIDKASADEAEYAEEFEKAARK